MLKKISFLRLHNAELLQYLAQYLAIIDSVADHPHALADAVRALKTVSISLEALHKSDPSSLMTAEILALDEERGDLYTGLLGHCRNLAFHSNPDMVEAGRILMHILDVYGNSEEVTKQSYAAESTDIDSLLDDLARPEAASALRLSGATMWSEPLFVSNGRFKERYLARTDEKAAREFAFTMKVKRAEAATAYDAVVRKINGFFETGDPAAWQPLIARLNAFSGEYRQLLAARRGQQLAVLAAE
ncbi:MAG: hypothetical protein EOO11_19790, partial [Chitinophagaceae bacterium]